MIDLEPSRLAATVNLSELLSIRTVAFDVPTFDRFRRFQRRMESLLRMDTANVGWAEYVICTLPELRGVQ